MLQQLRTTTLGSTFKPVVFGVVGSKQHFRCSDFNRSVVLNQTVSLKSVYRKHESRKRRSYEQQVREVEMASFTPPVFATSGGTGPVATTTYK